ncbi:MAG: protein translocase subunit SecF [Pseudomonadota bacterium]
MDFAKLRHMLRLVPDDSSFEFVAKRKLFITISVLMLIIGGVSLGLRGINFGIDFLGGILIETQIEAAESAPTIRTALQGGGFGDVSVQEFGESDIMLIRIERQSGGDQAQSQAIANVKRMLEGKVVEYRRVETVGPTIGAELRQAALWAVLSAIGAILCYIWLRFEWQFGLGAVLALTHDVGLALGLFALIGIEFNLASVAALLTIAGYSINDTVVIYDRVRENLRRFRKSPLEEICNRSINQTLARTLITSVTTMLALIALFVFGGTIIRNFALVMMFGVMIGTWSSIALAVPFLLWLRPAPPAEEEEQQQSPSDGIMP